MLGATACTCKSDAFPKLFNKIVSLVLIRLLDHSTGLRLALGALIPTLGSS